MKKRILIANRSEIAIRIICSAHKLGLIAVALKSDKDPEALYLNYADEIISVQDGSNEKPVFLDAELIVKLALENNIDLIHPGYGFLSENPDFAALCKENNINFVGPSAELIRNMGLKTIAKEMAIKSGLPLVPGSAGPVKTEEEAEKNAAEIGYPVILKAAAGGGGRGMRIVEKSEQLKRSFKSATDEAVSAFGNGDLFIEKYIQNPKHIEFQILGDKFGNVIHLGERECSLQRKHQKLIEEAPSASVSAQMRAEMGEMAVKFAKAIGYYSAGTIEFILDEDGRYYFMEMNTRIQVEHPVTEMITDIDLVDWQIRIALDEQLTLNQQDIKIDGWAIEIRVNAEDAQNRFSPQTGLIDRIHFPVGGHVRTESGVETHSVVTSNFDSMIAKIIVKGNDRNDAIDKTLKALNNFSIAGIKTTVPFAKAVLQHPDFVNATYTTRWIDHTFTPEILENSDDEMIGALAASILYASEYLQLSSDVPAYKPDRLNVWVLNKRLTY